MKKYIVPVLVLTVCLSFMLTGCKEKLKQSYGTVCDIQRSGDTLLNMRMVTGEGDRLNLKSKLSQYVSMANIFSNGEIPELEIIAYEKEDIDKLVSFMING